MSNLSAHVIVRMRIVHCSIAAIARMRLQCAYLDSYDDVDRLAIDVQSIIAVSHANLSQAGSHNVLIIHLSLCGNLAKHHDHVVLAHYFAGYTAVLVLL
jgi:hypothetical protein